MSNAIDLVVEEEFKNSNEQDRVSQLEEIFYSIIKRTIENRI
ncbi:hypothetical protein [Sporosalibacterium faouarense]|nr:hypothetical protein [Sporosalibacterium faouarense]